jgi:hypothetical protein
MIVKIDKSKIHSSGALMNTVRRDFKGRRAEFGRRMAAFMTPGGNTNQNQRHK